MAWFVLAADRFSESLSSRKAQPDIRVPDATIP
jgi:hypothetical protein